VATEGTDFAALALSIDSTDAVTATKALDDLTAAGERAEEQATKEYTATQRVNAERRKAAEAAMYSGQATNEASKEVQKLLDKYDPLGTKLRSLEAQFASLNKAVKEGSVGTASDSAVDKTYKSLNDEITKTRMLMVAAGTATAEQMGVAAKGAMDLGLNTQYARRELMTLGREAMSGDFSRVPLTFGSLVAHSNLLAAILSPVGLAILSTAAAVGTLTAATVLGAREQREMAEALELTGNYADLTRGQMRDLSAAVADATLATMGQAKEIVTQLVQSGQIGSAAIGQVAMLASDYARATGKDIDKITPELIKLFSDPAKGAEELNKQMHFLAPTELEHIRHLERIGQLGEAQAELADRMSAKIPKQKDNLGTLETAWYAVRGAASSAWDAMLGIGRDQTLEEQLQSAQSALRLAQANMNNATMFSRDSATQGLAAAQARVADLEAKLAQERSKSSGESQAAQTNAVQNQAAALVRSVSQYAKIADLNDQLTLAYRLQTTTEEERVSKEQAIYELHLQILGLKRSATEEERGLGNLAISQTLKLHEAQVSAADAQVEAAYKLNLITEHERNQQKLFSDLEILNARQTATEKQLAVQNLTRLERARLEGELVLLQAQRNARVATYETEEAIIVARRTSMQEVADAQASGSHAAQQLAVIGALQEETRAIALRNAEIGRSRIEVDLLRQAEQERKINLAERGIGQNDGSEDDPETLRLREQIRLLREKQALESAGTVKGLQEEFRSPEDREQKQYEAQLEALDAYLATATGKIQDVQLLREGLEVMHTQRLNIIDQRRNAAVVQMEMQTWSLAADLLNQFAGKSRAAAIAAIAIQKGLAIASVLVNTEAAIARGYAELGPWAGAVNEGRMRVLEAFQVGLIGATGLAEAANTGGGGGGGGSAPVTSNNSAFASVPALQAPLGQSGQLTVIHLHGEQFSANQVRDLVEQINENTRNGGAVVVE
jgi:phage-related minor tail protein